jgi:secreted trypsin-like serine protease
VEKMQAYKKIGWEEILPINRPSLREKLFEIEQGGTGGPLMKFENDRFYFLGVASNSNKCGDGYPGLYIRLTQYMDYFTTKLK